MLKIKNKKDFVNLMNIVGGIMEDVDITFNNEKMKLRAVHSTNSNVLCIEIKKEFFEEYNLEKEVTYTINMLDFLKILKLCVSDVIVSPESNFLKIESGNDKFNISYFVGKKDMRDDLQFDHTTKIIIPSSQFYNVLKNAASIDAIGKLKIDNNCFTVESHNPRIKSSMQFINYKFLMNSNLESYFDLSLLLLSAGFENIFWDVEVGISDDMPLVIKGKNDLIKCEFILANRASE